MAAVHAVEDGGVVGDDEGCAGGASGRGGPGDGWGVYRHGSKLMVEDGAVFPRRCAVCDGEASPLPVRVRLVAHWNCSCSPVVSRKYPELTGKCGYTGPVTVELHLCARHRRRRAYLWGLMGLLVLLPLAYWAWLVSVGGATHKAQWIIPLLLLVAGSAGIWNVSVGSWNPWLKAFRYRDRYVWLVWASPAFVARLPHFEGPPVKTLRAAVSADRRGSNARTPSQVARA